MINKGDIVRPINEVQLHCGSHIYQHAVVVSVDPFIMVSKSSDMKWSHHSINNFVKVGVATKKQLKLCETRLTTPEKDNEKI